MTREMFMKFMAERIESMKTKYEAKNREYSDAADVFSNFKQAAAMNGNTPQEALWGMLTKHIISIKDMVYGWNDFKDQYRNERMVKEKIGDAVVYLILLEGMMLNDIEEDNEKNRINF